MVACVVRCRRTRATVLVHQIPDVLVLQGLIPSWPRACSDRMVSAGGNQIRGQLHVDPRSDAIVGLEESWIRCLDPSLKRYGIAWRRRSRDVDAGEVLHPISGLRFRAAWPTNAGGPVVSAQGPVKLAGPPSWRPGPQESCRRSSNTCCNSVVGGSPMARELQISRQRGLPRC